MINAYNKYICANDAKPADRAEADHPNSGQLTRHKLSSKYKGGLYNPQLPDGSQLLCAALPFDPTSSPSASWQWLSLLGDAQNAPMGPCNGLAPHPGAGVGLGKMNDQM